MSDKYYIGTREVDGPRVEGVPIRHYYFESVSTRPHWHDDIEILYVRKGSMTYYIADRELVIKRGDIVLISPFVLHYGKSDDNEIGMSVYVFKPEFLCPSTTHESVAQYFSPIIKGKKKLPVVIHDNHKAHRKLAECLDRLDKAENEKHTAFELVIRNELSRFIALLYQHSLIEDIDISFERGAKSVKKAISYISRNYTSKLTVKELASVCGFSQSYFMSIFKQHTGMSCITYINQVKIESAKELLKNTELSILEISEQTGFNSVSLFNRTFKKLVDKTPKEYRKSDS